MNSIRKVTCPFCGYAMPIRYEPDRASCEGLFVKCKGRNCGKVFEIIVRKSSDK